MCPAQLGEGTTEKWPLSKPSERNPSDLPLISGGKIFVHLDARGLLLNRIFWKTFVSSTAFKSLRTRYLPRLRCRKKKEFAQWPAAVPLPYQLLLFVADPARAPINTAPGMQHLLHGKRLHLEEEH